MLCQTGNKVVHKRIDACIICGGCENQLGVTESIAQCLGHIVSCKIIDNNVWTSFAAEFIGQLLNGHFCMTVYRSVGDHDSVILRCVGRPGIIEANIMSKIFSKNRSVEWADGLDIQSCGYFQKILHLHTIFSNDADIVSSCLIVPWFLCIQGAEFSEAVCGKKNLFCAVISDHNLRPVNHRCKYKSQIVFSKGKGSAVIYDDLMTFQIQVKEVLHHGEGFFVGNNDGVRISLQEVCDVGCVIRFHMLYDQIIRFPVTQNFLDIIKPFVSKICIYRIHNRNFFVQDHIGVVGHAVRHFVLALKKVNLMIINAYIFDGICDFHERFLFSFYGGFIYMLQCFVCFLTLIKI